MADDQTTNQEENKQEEEKAEETPKEEPKEEKKPAADLSKNLSEIIEKIASLSVLELSQLVKALEEKFGVSAAPAVVAGAPQASAGGGEEGASEQTTFNVVLADSGANKISVIKVVRELVPTLGLKEAKDLVDAPPKPVLEGVNKEAANEAKTKLEAAGAKVELK
jgi:large subunit ribosomal protein L7/L12